MINDTFDRTLIIAPHADDEVIGCGGIIRRLIKSGCSVSVIIVTVGDIRFYHSNKVVTQQERTNEFFRAMESLGVTDYKILIGGYDGELDTLPIKDVVSVLDRSLIEYKPSAVLIPYPSFHQDHKVVFDASFAALRPSPITDQIKLIAVYEYPFIHWELEDKVRGGSFYVCIDDEIEDKLKAFDHYESQIRNNKCLITPEAITLWARRRGLESRVEYAEMLRVIKGVVR